MSTADEDRAEMEKAVAFKHWSERGYSLLNLCERLIAEKAAAEARGDVATDEESVRLMHTVTNGQLRAEAERRGYMLCRWEPAPYVGEDECSFVSNPDGELTVPLFQPTEGKYKWLSGLTAAKEGV